MAFFILRTHYPSGRTWANILLFVWLCVYSIKTGIRRIMRPDELRFVVRRSRRISKESSSRRIMRLVPVFILKTHNQMNYKCLPTLVKTNNAFSSIKTDNKSYLHSTCAQMNQNIQCTKVNQTFELFSFTKNGTKLAARNATAKAKSRARKNELITAQIFSLWRKQNTQRTWMSY